MALLDGCRCKTTSRKNATQHYASFMDDLLHSSMLRFLEAMSRPGDAQKLGPSLIREIYYRILTGEQGGSMRAALSRRGHFGKNTRAIRKIHSCYHEHLDVEALGHEANMSIPNFHLHFRSVTDSTPMQYLKSTRLHQTRLFMLRNTMSALRWLPTSRSTSAILIVLGNGDRMRTPTGC